MVSRGTPAKWKIFQVSSLFGLKAHCLENTHIRFFYKSHNGIFLKLPIIMCVVGSHFKNHCTLLLGPTWPLLIQL